VFQVNLSRGWQAEFGAPVAPASLFARLMQKNPAPFSALLQMEEWAIGTRRKAGRLDPSGRPETRLIAGTIPEADAMEDAALRARLEPSLKRRTRHAGRPGT
jgi:anthranilate synthase component 1